MIGAHVMLRKVFCVGRVDREIFSRVAMTKLQLMMANLIFDQCFFRRSDLQQRIPRLASHIKLMHARQAPST